MISARGYHEENTDNRYTANSVAAHANTVVMYIDMNSYFASCEQQLHPELRGVPIAVTAGDKYYSVIIAPSIEAKQFGVKTGMRLNEAKLLCAHLRSVPANPVYYRKVHMGLMKVLRTYCLPQEVIPKSIDEAAMNMTSYQLVYKDMKAVARQIKRDLAAEIGPYVTCSIGIAPNTFLAKVATDFQKPNGLVEITAENLDEYLGKLTLTDLPGIGSRNQRRLELVGIKTPLQMRHTSQSLLRKAFGGIAGYYWHSRLNMGEVDLYSNGSSYRSMSATRMVSPEQRSSYEKLDALLVSLCTKLEHRLVTSGKFCHQIGFFIRYSDSTSWEMHARFNDAAQDAMEMRRYILEHMHAFEQSRNCGPLLNEKTKQMGVTIMDFLGWKDVQYGLFDNRLKQDHLRKILYGIKDRYGKYSVRKATELTERSQMVDAIGFGSVKDLYEGGNTLNKYLLEEVDE
jgi:DNA polymerase-4